MAQHHRGDVDGLRAIAVLSVIVYHIDSSQLPGGLSGVDCFFVISGFCVAGSLLRRTSGDEPSRSLGSFLVAFYARRVKRLMPCLLCATLATSLGIAILIDPSVADAYFETAQYALLGVANNFFAATGSGYAAGGPAALEYNPLTHTWSLGVEGESRNL